jgi:hypothetical protein
MVALTKCPGCGEAVSHNREHSRAARRRTYCSTRCRRRAERTRAWNARSAISPRTAIIPGPEGASTRDGRKAPSNPLKSLADNSRKLKSRGGIWRGDSPFDGDLWQHVLNVEVIARRWRSITSSGGVVCEVSVLRPRALQAKVD